MELPMNKEEIMKKLKTSTPKELKPSNQPIQSVDMREKFIGMINEVSILIKDPSAYQRETEKMAASIAEMANFGYTLVVDQEKEIRQLKEENSKLKMTIKNMIG